MVRSKGSIEYVPRKQTPWVVPCDYCSSNRPASTDRGVYMVKLDQWATLSGST